MPSGTALFEPTIEQKPRVQTRSLRQSAADRRSEAASLSGPTAAPSWNEIPEKPIKATPARRALVQMRKGAVNS